MMRWKKRKVKEQIRKELEKIRLKMGLVVEMRN